ncbi:DinB family protein [Pseudarthrobacter sp. S9]|uniref:DinB family protein n=1 Tax=Pseudarthrobacter sp. S9 TaxID=3418421 RepID=UPI003D02083F
MALDRDGVLAGYRRNCSELSAVLAAASPAELRQGSAGTRWTNEELLFHMVFGYLVVLALLPLVRGFGRLPPRLSQGFAALLNAGTMPFDVVNYWGSRAGARVYNRRRMAAKLCRVTASLERRLGRENEAGLRRSMFFPTRWDPFFNETMSLADVYAYPIEHFDFHAAQLSLDLHSRPETGAGK